MSDPQNEALTELTKRHHDFAEAANKDIGRLQGQVEQLDRRLCDAGLRIDLLLECLLRAGLKIPVDILGEEKPGLL